MTPIAALPNAASRSAPLPLVAAALVIVACAWPQPAAAVGECRFAKRPPVELTDMAGFCKFDPQTHSFAGDPAEQARCLLNPVRPVGRLGPALETLPAALAARVGKDVDLPAMDALAALLRDRGAPDDTIAALSRPLSRANDNDPQARAAAYIVFHDTSTPNYRTQPWPQAIDDDPKINNLKRYACSNNIERAHVFINRRGGIFQPHDFSVPWRATKFETATNYGTALKGLFLHIELIQPRRAMRGYGSKNDFLAPDPGFTKAQYDSLALTYAVASLRAGAWLIPAFHSVIDEGIRNKHDDPQNFDLPAFAQSLDKLVAELRERTAALGTVTPPRN
jgi:hypothetical protein